VLYAGSRQFQVAGHLQDPPLTALLHYPTERPSSLTPFGPYELDVSVEAPVAKGRFPLVLISHGSGGAPLLYRSISLLLARSGYIAALPKHAGNSLGDNDLRDHDLTGAEAILSNRPRQLITLLDALLRDATWAAAIADEPVVAMGHSLGGYTALCVAGGQPWTRARQPIPVVHDARIGAVVLMAPACGPFLAPQALTAVTAPILAFTAEHDRITPDAEVRAALGAVADATQVTIRMVPKAGHFSFLSPFPSSMRDPQFAPANDPSGFDREAFHHRFPTLVEHWIRERRALRGLPIGR
jgi:predicted dienelactone hydrolase